MYFDWTYVYLVLPAFIFALWASANVNGTFKKYSKVHSRRNITGAEAARRISSMICAVLPAPARPVMSLSMARDPLTFVQHYNIYFSEFKTLEKATLLC